MCVVFMWVPLSCTTIVVSVERKDKKEKYLEFWREMTPPTAWEENVCVSVVVAALLSLSLGIVSFWK